MLHPRHALLFRPATKRRLYHATKLFNCLTEQKTEDVKSTQQFDSLKQLLDFSNSSLRPYINTEKIDLLKFYCKKSKKSLSTSYNFVINEAVAKDIVKKVLYSGQHKKQVIVEGNPGLGLITVNLINSGVSHILLYDDSKIQDVCLTQLLARHSERITKKSGNMERDPTHVLLNSLDFSQQHGLPMTIIGVTSQLKFLKSLVIDFMKYDLLQSNLSVFLVLTTSKWKWVNAASCHKNFKFPMYSMFHLIFIVEEIAQYPHEAFLPLCEDNETMTLFKISINPDCFKTITKEEYKDYLTFLQILGTSYYNYIIPTLEKWLPNCGLYLISKGISLTLQVHEISHSEALLLFKYFRECEGYQDFKVYSAEMFSRKMNLY